MMEATGGISRSVFPGFDFAILEPKIELTNGVACEIFNARKDVGTRFVATPQVSRAFRGLSECYCMRRAQREWALATFVQECCERVKEGRIHVVSVGAAGMLQELFLVQALAEAGYKQVALDLVDWKFSAENATKWEPQLKELTALCADLPVEVHLEVVGDLAHVNPDSVQAVIAIDALPVEDDFWAGKEIRRLKASTLLCVAKGQRIDFGSVAEFIPGK